MMESQITREHCSSVYQLRHEMNKSGYTDIATSVGIRSLSRSGFIETSKEVENDTEFIACRLTEKGENWIMSNEDQLQYRQTNAEGEDDLPF